MILDKSIWENAMDYPTYRQLIDTLLTQSKTTGTHQSPELVNYTRLNQQRMQRIELHSQLNQQTIAAIQTLPDTVWLVLSEGWCGDAAQNLPYIHKMASVNPKINLRIILRDEHPEIMDRFLTNGSRSIPKLIWIHPATGEVLSQWGPRPTIAQQMVLEMKAQGIPHDEYVKAVHAWYAKDKGEQIQKEFIEMCRRLNRA